MLSFRRQRTQRERERRTRHALEDAKRLDDNANKTMTTLINRRRERRASNERCASTPKKGRDCDTTVATRVTSPST